MTATAVTLLAGTLSSCSDDGVGSGGSAEPSTSSQPPGIETKAALGTVNGRLAPDRRQRLTKQVTTTVDAWLDAAYIGSYPRSDFRNAFASFTADAADDARTDRNLMSNTEIGDRLDSAVATTRRLRIDVLAPRGRAVGVTARFVLVIDLTGEIERADRVAGRLFMGSREGEWRVFGYDVNRGRA